MIVKNVSDYHNSHLKQAFQYHEQHPQHSQITDLRQIGKQKQNQNKPYFLLGLQNARQFLVKLKMKKQNQQSQELQYSPIGRKNTKISISNDTVNNQNQTSPNTHLNASNEKNQKHENEKKGLKIKKSTKVSHNISQKYTSNKNKGKHNKYHRSLVQNEIDESLPEQQQSITTTKFKQSQLRQQNINEHQVQNENQIQKQQYEYKNGQNYQNKYTKYTEEDQDKNEDKSYQNLERSLKNKEVSNHIPQKRHNNFMQQSKCKDYGKNGEVTQNRQLENKKGNQSRDKKVKQQTSIQLKRQLQNYENQINKIGNQLYQVHNQIENYQIVFDNLCDCYRANQNIYNKNQKLKRQSIRLQEQKEEIIRKINNLDKQNEELDELERKSNEYICKRVQEYIWELCYFNQDIELSTVKFDHSIYRQLINSANMDDDLEGGSLQIKQEQENKDNDQQIYSRNLTLNYKRMKQKYDQRMKKKGLLQPKKLQKGVSFQQQIDVITKYYESQLTNI